MKNIDELVKDEVFLSVKEQFKKDNLLFILTDPKYERYHTRILYHLIANDNDFLKSFLTKYTRLPIDSFRVVTIGSEKIEDDRENIKDISCDVAVNKDKYKLIFEIKLNATEGNDQISRYKKEAEDEKKSKKISDFYVFYIRLNDLDEGLDDDVIKITKKDLLLSLKESSGKLAYDYLIYLEISDAIQTLDSKYDLAQKPSEKVKYDDKYIIDYIKQFHSLGARKLKGQNFYGIVYQKFQRYAKTKNYRHLCGEATRPSQHNPILLFWDKSFESYREKKGVDIHYEFQNNKKDCLKIHIEVDKEDEQAVKLRHRIYPIIQKDLRKLAVLNAYGLITPKLLVDSRSCNQLCKFENVILDEHFEKNKIFPALIEINNQVRTVIKKRL